MSTATAPNARILSLADILAAEDLPTLTVDIPEWQGAVVIGTISAAQRNRYIQDATEGDGVGGLRVNNDLAQRLLIAAALVEPAVTLEDVNALFNKSAAAMQRIQTAALAHNKMDAASQEAIAAQFRPQPGA